MLQLQFNDNIYTHYDKNISIEKIIEYIEEDAKIKKI